MAALSRAAIAERVKYAREHAGLKQHELADLLHVHSRTVQYWESQADPIVAWDRLDEIAQATGVTKEWLIHGDPQQADPAEIQSRLQGLEVAVAEGFERLEGAIEQLAVEVRRRSAP